MATTNPGYLRCKEERNNKSFFMVLQSVDVSSENLVESCRYMTMGLAVKRALPYDFVRSFTDKELSLGISKNPTFYYMEKSGWEKFVRDNTLGTLDGKEMMQPPQPRAFLASSSRIRRFRTEQGEDDKKEEVVSESSNRGRTTAAESVGRKLKLGKKAAEESQESKRTEKVVRARRDEAGASSYTAVEFTAVFQPAYFYNLRIRSSVKDQMPVEKTIFKVHHPNGKKFWNVVYLGSYGAFSGGWQCLVKEYPLVVGDTCKFTFIKPEELLLVVSKP
ncbi:putative B3 domain-containing protein [Arabidopsis thaliana]